MRLLRAILCVALVPSLILAAARPVSSIGTRMASPSRAADVADGDLLTALRGALAGRVVDGVRQEHAVLEMTTPPGALATAWMRLTNTGTTTWHGAYGLYLVAGEPIGLPAIVLLPDVAPGEMVEVPVSVRAPSRLGARRDGAWVMRNAGARPFGLPVRLSLLAVPATPSPLPTPRPTPRPPAPSPTLTPVPTLTPSATEPPRSPTPTPLPTLRPHPTSSPAPRPLPAVTPRPTRTAVASTPTALPVPTGVLATPTPILLVLMTPTAETTAGVTPPPTALPAVTGTTAAGSLSLTPSPSPPAQAAGGVSPWAGQHHLLREGPLPGSARWAAARRAPVSAAASPTLVRVFGAAPLDAHNRQDLALLNLGPRVAHTWIVIQDLAGGSTVAYVPVRRESVRRVHLNPLDGTATDAVITVRSDAPLAMERILSHASDTNEGTAGSVTYPVSGDGTQGPMGIARVSIFPREVQDVTLFNTGSGPATASVRFSTSSQPGPTLSLSVAPGAARLLSLGGLPRGIVVRPLAGGPLVLSESTSYGRTNGQSSLPPAAPRTRWYFAPTAVVTGGHSFVTVLNPSAAPATVILREAGAGGDAPITSALGAGVQRALEPARLLPHHAVDRWLVVDASMPVIASRVTVLPPGAERSLARTYAGNLATAGIATPARRIAFASGDTRPLQTGIVESLFLYAPGRRATPVRVTYLTAGGRSAAQGFALSAGGATMVSPSRLVGQSLHGVLVEAAEPVVAALLWQFNGGVYAAESRGCVLDDTAAGPDAC